MAESFGVGGTHVKSLKKKKRRFGSGRKYFVFKTPLAQLARNYAELFPQPWAHIVTSWHMFTSQYSTAVHQETNRLRVVLQCAFFASRSRSCLWLIASQGPVPRLQCLQQHFTTPMDKYLRDWREDAVRKNQHETAIFVGDKVLALTSTLTVRIYTRAYLLTDAQLQKATRTPPALRTSTLTMETIRAPIRFLSTTT